MCAVLAVNALAPYNHAYLSDIITSHSAARRMRGHGRDAAETPLFRSGLPRSRILWLPSLGRRRAEAYPARASECADELVNEAQLIDRRRARRDRDRTGPWRGSGC
jgi:hypothetical protein